jgi:O-antigen/teichoic acid export membrane protein
MLTQLKKLKSQEVFKNFSYLTIGGFISQAIGLITLIKIARIFSPDNYGLYTFLLIQGQLIITIGDLGIKNIIVRTIARDRFKTMELLRAGVGLKIASVILLSFLYLGYNAIWGHLSNTEVLLISIFGILNCLTNLYG